MNRLLIIFILLPCLVFSQLEFKKAVKIDSISEDILFNRAKQWADKASKVPEKVIKLDDSDTGILVLNINYKYRCRMRTGSKKHSGLVAYTLEFFIRNGGYDYRLYGFRHPTQGLLYDTEMHPGNFDYPSERKYFDRLWKDIINQNNTEIGRIVNSLEIAMSKPLESE